VGTLDRKSQGDVLRRAKRGDRVAFAEIVSRYHLQLLRLAYLVCGERALAEDAVQNAWYRAWRKLDQVRDPAALAGWLLAIAGNEARRAATKRGRQAAVYMPEELTVGDEGIADGAAQRADLRAALARLEPLDREVIALRHLWGMTAAEIGEYAGLSAEGVRSRLFRALKKLRQELDGG
jgi:RNA polymerase sigma-70 factor (ECF subfamily)